MLFFVDRRDAGSRLTDAFTEEIRRAHAVVLALPRGGVPVGYEIARRLELPLDIFMVRKVRMPGQPELTLGTVASGGSRVLNDAIIREAGVPPSVVDFVFEQESEEVVRRENAYRHGAPPIDVKGRTVILVDDGLAADGAMRVAAAAVRRQDPARLIAAVPVAAASTIAELAKHVDEIVCIAAPAPFCAAGLWYRDFEPTTDEEVTALLERARELQLA